MIFALFMPLAMPLEKVADKTIAAKGDACTTSTVAFSGMEYMTGTTQLNMVNLFNAAASSKTVKFLGAGGCSDTGDFTYHHPSCTYDYGKPTNSVANGMYTMSFSARCNAATGGCTTANSCLGSMLSSTPFSVSCASPKVEYTFKAVGGGDWYETVVGLYSVDASDPPVESLVDSHVYRGDTITSFVTKEFTGFPAGTYFLRFFGASYDYTGGRVLGAKLYVTSATGTFSPLPEFDSPPPPAPPAAPVGSSMHGDPMFQHDGKSQHFWLKEGVLSPLLEWTSDDGSHKMSLQGVTVANPETGHQWFKQIALVRDGKQVLSSEVVVGDKPTLALSSLDSKTVIIDTFVKGNGDDAKDVTGVSLGGMTFELSAESAHKFDDAAARAKYAHVNVKLPNGLIEGATGLFAELAGAKPMSEATKALLRSPE